MLTPIGLRAKEREEGEGNEEDEQDSEATHFEGGGDEQGDGDGDGDGDGESDADSDGSSMDTSFNLVEMDSPDEYMKQLWSVHLVNKIREEDRAILDLIYEHHPETFTSRSVRNVEGITITNLRTLANQIRGFTTTSPSNITSAKARHFLAAINDLEDCYHFKLDWLDAAIHNIIHPSLKRLLKAKSFENAKAEERLQRATAIREQVKSLELELSKVLSSEKEGVARVAKAEEEVTREMGTLWEGFYERENLLFLVTDSTSKPLDTEAAKISFNTDEKSTLQASPPQFDLPTGTSSLKLEPSVPSSQPYSTSQSRNPLDIEAAKISFNTDEKSTLQASPPQPDLPTCTSSLKLEPSVPSSQPSSTSQSGNRLSFSVTPNAALNPKPEQPSVAPPPVQLSEPALSTSETDAAGENESSNVASTQEDEMEEEEPEIGETNEVAIGNLGGFGIGSTPNPTAPKPNPFGGSFLNTPANPPQSSSFTMAVPAGELSQPPSFSFPFAQPSSQPSQPQTTNFGSFGGGFGRPVQPGAGKQVLESVLGSFGQSRQIGTSLPSASGFGGGFGVTHPTGGFSSATTGGDFVNVASTAGGFTSVVSGGGGFASDATVGGGFASAGGGFARAATAGGGFASTGGFGGASIGGGFGGSASGGGFGGFSNQQGGSGGFTGFGNSGGTGRPPSELFTQIRK